MVRAHSWSAVALVTLCHASLQGRGAGDSVNSPESTTFVMPFATSDATPIWLILPILLDIQPALLKLNVKHHMPVQLQSFCREHGMQMERCTGAIQQALDQVVNFQRFCKQSTTESALPGFVVARNVLRENGGPATASWMQNDPEDISLDLCSFVQRRLGVHVDFDESVPALESALSRSFEWLLALTPCGKEFDGSNEVSASKLESLTVSERLVTIEQMIAALKGTSVDDSESRSSLSEGDPVASTNLDFSYDSGTVEEISATGELAMSFMGDAGAEMEVESTVINELKDEAYPMPTSHSDDIAVDPEEKINTIQDQETSALIEGSEVMCITGTYIQPGELVDETTRDDTFAEKQETTQILGELSTADIAVVKNWGLSAVIQDTNSISEQHENEMGGAINMSCEARYTTTQEEEMKDIAEELQSQTPWKVAVALMLALSAMYVVVDLMLTSLHYFVWIPKQLTETILQAISLLMNDDLPNTLMNEANSDVGSDYEEVIELVEFAPVEAEQSAAAQNREPSNAALSELEEVEVISEIPSPVNEANEVSEQPQQVERPTIALGESVILVPQEHNDVMEHQVETRLLEANASSTSNVNDSTEIHELFTPPGAVDTHEQEMQEEFIPERVEVSAVVPLAETVATRSIDPSSYPRNVPTHVEVPHAATQIGASVSLLWRLSIHKLPSKTSFTCLAMMLMAGSHGPVFRTRGSSPQATVLSSYEVISIIRQKMLRERTAVRCIQRAWKAAQHNRITEEEPVTRADVSSLLEEVLRSKITCPPSTFHLLSLRAKAIPEVPKTELGFSHLIHNALRHRPFSAA